MSKIEGKIKRKINEIAFFLFETFKEDVTEQIISVVSYANTVRRAIIDVGAKIVTHSGRNIVKFFRVLYEQIKCNVLWEKVLSPPEIVDMWLVNA